MTPIPFAGFADPISSWSHLLAACAALVGTGSLLTKGRGNTSRTIALLVFSFSLVFLFSMSGVFHLLDRGSDSRGVLQRLDHAGIWTLIAATFVPIHTILFRGHRRWLILVVVWTAAITGMVLEMVFFHDVPEYVLLSLFLGLGWIGALSAYHFRKTYGDPSLQLLAWGGILYSIGAAIDFAQWPIIIEGVIGPHEIFHFFIIAAAFFHWLFVYRWSNHPVNNTLVFEVVVFPDRVVANALKENMKIEGHSIEEVKKLIRVVLSDRYHSSIEPKVRLRYFSEEHLSK